MRTKFSKRTLFYSNRQLYTEKAIINTVVNKYLAFEKTIVVQMVSADQASPEIRCFTSESEKDPPEGGNDCKDPSVSGSAAGEGRDSPFGSVCILVSEEIDRRWPWVFTLQSSLSLTMEVAVYRNAMPPKTRTKQVEYSPY